jgi:hypothetical protein
VVFPPSSFPTRTHYAFLKMRARKMRNTHLHVSHFSLLTTGNKNTADTQTFGVEAS